MRIVSHVKRTDNFFDGTPGWNFFVDIGDDCFDPYRLGVEDIIRLRDLCQETLDEFARENNVKR